MTYEDAFERRLEVWLANGPVTAPAGAVNAAVDHARRNPQRRRAFAGLRRALMSTVPLTPVANPVSLRWMFAGVSLVVIVMGVAVFGVFPRGDQSAGAVPTSSPTGRPTNATTATPSATSMPVPTFLPVGAVAPAFFTAQVESGSGSACSVAWCQFGAIVTATDARISGSWVVDARGETTAGTFGTVVAFTRDVVGGGYIPISMLPAEKRLWDGEWFGGGANMAGFKDGLHPIDIDASKLWPVDTFWMHGRNENAGLTAFLRMTDATTIEGWIFQTPPSE